MTSSTEKSFRISCFRPERMYFCLLFLILCIPGEVPAQEHTSTLFLGPKLNHDVVSGNGTAAPEEGDFVFNLTLGYRWFSESRLKRPWGIHGSLGFGFDSNLSEAAALNLRIPFGLRPVGTDKPFTFNLGPEFQYILSFSGAMILGAGGIIEDSSAVTSLDSLSTSIFSSSCVTSVGSVFGFNV